MGRTRALIGLAAIAGLGYILWKSREAEAQPPAPSQPAPPAPPSGGGAGGGGAGTPGHPSHPTPTLPPPSQPSRPRVLPQPQPQPAPPQPPRRCDPYEAMNMLMTGGHPCWCCGGQGWCVSKYAVEEAIEKYGLECIKEAVRRAGWAGVCSSPGSPLLCR